MRGLYVRRTANSLILLAASNLVFLLILAGMRVLCLPAFIGAVYVLLRPIPKTMPAKRLQRLADGCELLRLFLITATVNAVWMAALLPSVVRDLSGDGFFRGLWMMLWMLNAIGIVLVEAILFWSGMIMVYITSVQLGIKHRVLAALCGWIPFLNI